MIVVVYETCVLWCNQLEKDTRSDSEVEETSSEDESVDRMTLNNNSAVNRQQNSEHVNAISTSSQNKKDEWVK